MWGIERPASLMDQNPTLSQNFCELIEIDRLCASEWHLLNHRIFPKSSATTVSVAREYYVLNTAVNIPANSIKQVIIIVELPHFQFANIQI
jgi:hypothetical protein